MTETELRKLDLEIANLIAETAKLTAETMKIQAEARWYPFVVLAGVLGIALGIFKLLAG